MKIRNIAGVIRCKSQYLPSPRAPSDYTSPCPPHFSGKQSRTAVPSEIKPLALAGPLEMFRPLTGSYIQSYLAVNPPWQLMKLFSNTSVVWVLPHCSGQEVVPQAGTLVRNYLLNFSFHVQFNHLFLWKWHWTWTRGLGKIFTIYKYIRKKIVSVSF